MPATNNPPPMRWQDLTSRQHKFACGANLPEDWTVVPIPPDPPDFSQPENFMPIGIAMAKYAAIVFTVAVRPKLDDGPVAQWLVTLAQRQGFEVTEPILDHVGEIEVAAAQSMQHTEAGEMRARLHLFEDGGNLFNVSVMAPAALFESMVPTFQGILASFKLSKREGATVPLFAAAAPETTGEEQENDYADLRLADDDASLGEEHPMNRHFRDHGIGLVPRVLATDEQRRFATVGAGAIMATFGVPFGWHVIDDGKRTLVFDAGNEIQVNLNLVNAGERTDDDLFGETLAGMQQRHAQLQHIRLELAGMPCLGLRGIVEDDQALEQAYLIRRGTPSRLALVTRVTAVPGKMVMAMNLAELVHRDLSFGGDGG